MKAFMQTQPLRLRDKDIYDGMSSYDIHKMHSRQIDAENRVEELEQYKSEIEKTAEVLGWVSVAAILMAYAMLSFDGNALFAQMLNFLGATGIIVVSAKKKAWQPMVLNIVWLFISLISIFKLL